MKQRIETAKKKNTVAFAVLIAVLIALCVACLLVGSSNMRIADSFAALFGRGTAAQERIIRNIRIPTLGVSNAAVFGANVSIIVGAGGFLETGNHLSSYTSGINLYATSLVAFLFAALSILLILGLCRMRAFTPGVVVLAGIAIGAVWTAATTVLQFYATDVGLSAAVIWTFGDLGRATYRSDLLMALITLPGIAFFSTVSWRLNALLSGDAAAGSMGVNVNVLRFSTMLVASLITAVCVSFLGVIGFVGIICPHIVKRILGHDHRVTVPASALCGSILLLIADTLSRSIGSGSALPVGAITSLFGAPFFLAIIFLRRGHADHA